MKTNLYRAIKNCPRCGGTYRQHPALSRVDNKTFICPDCGIREALETIGIEEKELENILEIVRKYTQN